MQTFLPYSDFEKSARVLDRKRLGKQRVEALQIMKVLVAPESNAWRNHPAVLMWEGYETALLEYQKAICNEWTSRGYKDTCLEKTEALFDTSNIDKALKMPDWLNKSHFHASHRSNLLRKDSDWYSQFGWEESDDMEYSWPTRPTRLTLTDP